MKQVKWMKRVTITAGVLALGAWGLTAEPANATFIKDPSPGGIHFNIDLANKDVSTFSGKVGTDVVNVATIGNVNTGSGYANIDPVKDGTLSSLIFTPVNPNLFGDFSFRGQLLEAGSVKVTVTDNQGDPAQSFTFSGLPANANFDRIGIIAQAGSGETIKSVTLSSFFKEEKQNEFSVAAAIPEPETYAMLGLGIALLGVAVRRRNMI